MLEMLGNKEPLNVEELKVLAEIVVSINYKFVLTDHK